MDAIDWIPDDVALLRKIIYRWHTTTIFFKYRYYFMLQVNRINIQAGNNKIYKFQEVRIKVRDESETQKSSNITCVINVLTCFRTRPRIIAKKI